MECPLWSVYFWFSPLPVQMEIKEELRFQFSFLEKLKIEFTQEIRFQFHFLGIEDGTNPFISGGLGMAQATPCIRIG